MTRPPEAVRTAVVTGAAQGIGAAVAQALFHDGCFVVLLDHDEELGQRTTASLDPPGTRTTFITCDVTDASQVAAAMRTAHERNGRLDILVNNAGINAYYDATAISETQWDAVMAVDLKAFWLCAKHALPLLIGQPESAIVNIGSIHARLTSAGTFPYAVAKAGVEGLTRSLALDYGPSGVRVNTVAPGWTQTRLVQDWIDASDNPHQERDRIRAAHPLGRIVQPAEIAAAVAFLSGPGASAITGATIPVDCGLSSRFAL